MICSKRLQSYGVPNRLIGSLLVKGNDIFESKIGIAPIEDYKYRAHIILPLKE